ncbi:GGDEF domain-containing protein [Rhizobiales bacterium]|uniref:GGDEF domain-containing protein n=1 Tax=Hongsoonwoonella zoysiae TaxID=2821844 RepID=UPI00155FDBCF|nr:GGDEF domain-containing protein [Hongsoonwoonella zoysiae]NRG19820.1 GGDEF domain-containing protein [Hongsoonwoonella zoysiae]
MELTNVILLFGEASLYFFVMVSLLEARHKIGLGVFFCALGVMHFLETYLASVFYVALPFGVISPGSSVLFSGKLLMILLLYIKEDAAVVRQPIYGLLIGNFLIVGLVMILRNHDTLALIEGRSPNISFIDEMGWLMVWGTTLLFFDSVGIILLYERLGGLFREHPALRFLLCGLVMLTFDQLGFYLALRYVSGAPVEVLFGGWIAKMAAAVVYSVFFLIYMHASRTVPPKNEALGVSDIFHVLTYRERYEQLLESAARDHLTGVYDRGRYDIEAPRIIETNIRRSHPVSLMVIDIDRFKDINDTFGHTAGDIVLKDVAGILSTALRSGDHLFRFGGEEFVVVCERLPLDGAMSMANRLCRTIAETVRTESGSSVTVSIGVAAGPDDGQALAPLFKSADARLYRAKQEGRNRVCGRDGPYEREMTFATHPVA